MKKAILVYGAGISGLGAVELLLRHESRVILYGDREFAVDERLRSAIEKNGGRIVVGGGEALLSQVKEVVLSPGISIYNPLVLAAAGRDISVISEAELAYRFFKGHLLAVTGTNGKTTTTTIIGEMLKAMSPASKVGGNIGIALSLQVQDMPKDAWLAAEISSFQLEAVKSFKAEIAVILNITPDHLDRHRTMEEYINVKHNVFANQDPRDVAVLNFDDPIIRTWGAGLRSKICWFSRKEVLPQGVYLADGRFTIAADGKKIDVCHRDELQIFGGHNEENVLAAIAACYYAGVDVKQMRAVLRSFKGVEHRLEYVADIDGVPYYNDSKATNPDSTIKALEAFKGDLVLIAGGRDKNTPLEDMMTLVKQKVSTMILLGEATERFEQAAKAAGVKDIRIVKSMREAVALAYAIARKPQAVVLSPACSSFDMFANFPARGRCFKELVLQLKK